MKKLFVVLFLLTAALSFSQQNVSAPQKFALVIGNGNYTGISKLTNPVNDANDVSAALQGLGFTVDKVLDANLDQMENAIMKLKNRLSVSKNSYGFLFYAGHGVQSGGENYLIPVGANIPSENSLRDRAINVQWALSELNDAGNELNMVVLDACRDNPFSWKRSGNRGLTVVANQPADSIIVYATSAGSTAADGTGRNGLFTTHLLNNLKTPGIEVKEIFNRTGADVARASNRTQIPAVYSQFFDTAYLGNKPQTATTQQSAPTPDPVVQPAPQPAPAPAIQPVAQPRQTTTQPAQTTQQSTKTQPAAPTTKGISSNLGAFSLELPDNFQYAKNYEVKFTDDRLLNGHKIIRGETYTLKITYTASRDLEDALLIGLVDTSPAAGHWKPLTWTKAASRARIPASKAGEEISTTITLNTIWTATSASPKANALVFTTEGKGKEGVAGSGVQKAVTLNFTEFVFTKIE